MGKQKANIFSKGRFSKAIWIPSLVTLVCRIISVSMDLHWPTLRCCIPWSSTLTHNPFIPESVTAGQDSTFKYLRNIRNLRKLYCKTNVVVIVTLAVYRIVQEFAGSCLVPLCLECLILANFGRRERKCDMMVKKIEWQSNDSSSKLEVPITMK